MSKFRNIKHTSRPTHYRPSEEEVAAFYLKVQEDVAVDGEKIVYGPEVKVAGEGSDARWTIVITTDELPTRKAAMELEEGDVFLAEDGQEWTVVEVLPVANKKGSNVTVTSTALGYRQRASFSFVTQSVELVESK